jgi:Zinc carboxypeptidase
MQVSGWKAVAGQRAGRSPWVAVLMASMLWGCASAPLPPWPAQPPSRAVAAPAPVGGVQAQVPASAPPAPPAPPDAAPPGQPAESAGVAARFPDPPVSYRTPAFEPGRSGFTSNAELRAVLQGLVRVADGASGTTAIRLLQVGSSQTGVPIEALHFSRAPVPLASTGVTARAARPTVLLVGQQHGDEPAGAEALIVIAQELARGKLAAVLDRIDVVVLPRANPDGAAADKRVTAGGIDANRDHLLLRTPEAQAMAALAREFNPVVVVDAHEFSVLGRYVEKFGAAQRFDALIQYAMTANLPPFITKASEEWFRKPLLRALDAQGLSHEWYYTTSTDLADKKVSMGGVQPDTGRNVNGLRNAVSFLIETRGVGLGRAHLLRRVHTQVTAITSVLQSTAARADDLAKLRRFVDAETAAKACQGEVIVEAAASPSEYDLKMLDPVTGADKTVTVAWDSALELAPVKRRTRPCGYWLGADQADAALRLRTLGVQVQRIDEAGALRGETYAETAREVAARTDVRGSVADGAGVVRVKVELVPALIDVQAGGYYVGLDQPLANLVVAALEPDTQNGFVANQIVTDLKSQARVLTRPDLRMAPLP